VNNFCCIAGLLLATLLSRVGSAEPTPVVLRPLQEAEVSAQQTGLLLKLVVAEGESVRAGQVLASLDDQEVKLDVARARLEHARAEAEASNEVQIKYAEKSLDVARAELARSRESIDKFAKSISQSQLDVERLTVDKIVLERQQAEHELKLKRFGVQLQQNELDAARLRLQQHQLRAPFAGIVVLVRGRIGEWVEVGVPVLRLVAVDKLRAEGFLQVGQATADLVGRPVQIEFGSAAKRVQVTGILRFVSPEMDPVTKQVRIWAEVPNADGLLRPGQQGTLEILP